MRVHSVELASISEAATQPAGLPEPGALLLRQPTIPTATVSSRRMHPTWLDLLELRLFHPLQKQTQLLARAPLR